ncbi:hypothetical protein QBC40DRAFT_183669, partial [Triangularia verruculosa]
ANFHWPTIQRLLAKLPATISPRDRHLELATQLANEAKWNEKRLRELLLEAQGLCGAAEFAVQQLLEEESSGTGESSTTELREEREDRCRFFETLVEVLEGMYCRRRDGKKIKVLKKPVDEETWEDDFGEFP